MKLTGAQDASSNYVSFEDGYAQPPNEPSWFAQPIIAPAGNGVQHGKNIQFTDDLNWIKGNHSLVFGGDFRWQPTYLTADIAQGGISTPRAISDAIRFKVVLNLAEIPGQSSTCMTPCWVSSTNLSYYQPLNASTFQPVSGHPIADLETHTHSLYFYAQDSWRMKPSLTLTYGLAWGVQTPYTEDHGRGAVLVDASTNKPVDAVQVLATKKADALKGINYNPTYGFVPYGKLGMSGMWNTDYGPTGRHAPQSPGVPSADSGLLGKLFGNDKTVIRAGYAVVYDRYSGGTITHLPGQPGFNVLPSSSPLCDASGTPGSNCNKASRRTRPNQFFALVSTVPFPSRPQRQ